MKINNYLKKIRPIKFCHQFFGSLISFFIFFYAIIFAQEPKPSNFSFNGLASIYSKIGFNSQKYDPNNNIYPTDSYASLLAHLNIGYHFLEHFDLKLGVALNGLFFDSTRFQSPNNPQAPSIYNYIGFYQGHSGLSQLNPHFAFIHNAYFNYEQTFNQTTYQLKIGRYETENLDWFSDFNQGFQASIMKDGFEGLILFSDARASAYGDWFYDYGRYYTQNHPLIILQAGYHTPNLLLQSYLYESPNYYSAPGFHIEGIFGTSLKSKSTLIALFPFHHHTTPDTTDAIVFNQKLDSFSASLLLKEDLLFKNYTFGGAVYKNFGNANGRIGIYGDPINSNIWAGSLYANTSLTDIVSRDALSSFLFFNASYDRFSYGLMARYTHSLRGHEEALSLNFSSHITKTLDLALRLEYFLDTTFKGQMLGALDKNFMPITLKQTLRNDRSHMMLWLTQTF